MPPNASTQRVAKAARNKSRRGLAEQRNIKFPVLVAVIVILGSLLVGLGRERRVSSAEALPRVGRDHWHMAYGIYICDAVRPGLTDRRGDARGVHTHEDQATKVPDGIIHLHPSSSLSAGTKSNLGDFLYEIKLTVKDDEIAFPGGETFKNGQTCPDGRAGHVVLAKWQHVTEDAPPELITKNIASTRFENDLMGFVIAFIPDGVELEKPVSVAGLSTLTDIGNAAQPITPTTGEQTGDTIVAGDGPATTTAGGPADTTVTTAGGGTTVTTTAPSGAGSSSTSAPK